MSFSEFLVVRYNYNPYEHSHYNEIYWIISKYRVYLCEWVQCIIVYLSLTNIFIFQISGKPEGKTSYTFNSIILRYQITRHKILDGYINHLIFIQLFPKTCSYKILDNTYIPYTCHTYCCRIIWAINTQWVCCWVFFKLNPDTYIYWNRTYKSASTENIVTAK